MSTTHIDTNSIQRTNVNGQGQFAEILNKELCGAENVVGSLRWLKKGERFSVKPLKDSHQLVYLMEGEGVIELEKKTYDVKRGAGIYLGPSETASISHAGSSQLKLFHLVVPKKTDA
jgi:mannose-6-phosphate isomerase-like protein (cupin superfamily)